MYIPCFGESLFSLFLLMVMTKEACAQIGIGDHVATTGETALRMLQSRKTESTRVLDIIIGPLITVPGACFACVSQLCELCLLIV